MLQSARTDAGKYTCLHPYTAWTYLQNLPSGARVGVDPFLHTIDGARKLQKALDGAGLKMVPVFGGNLVDGVWTDRPQPPQVCKLSSSKFSPSEL